MEKKFKYLLISAGMILLLILSMVIEIPYSYSVQSKIVAGHEWLLIRQEDGSLTEMTRNNINGVIQNYSAYQIDRGDIVQFRLNPDLLERHQLSRSDTIGIFKSNFVAEDLSRLQGELDVAYAALKVNRTGEKQSVLKEAENMYALNLEQAKVQKRILARETLLFSDNLVSDQDYEITKGMAQIAQLEVQVAEARLQTLKTGAKPEEIDLVRAQIEAIQRNLETLKNRLRLSYMVSPVEGHLSLEVANDTLLIVSDSIRLAIIPVPVEYYNDITTGQYVSVQLPYQGIKLRGQVIRTEKEFRAIAGQQVFLVTALLERGTDTIPVNLVTAASIDAEPKTLWQHLKYLGESLFF